MTEQVQHMKGMGIRKELSCRVDLAVYQRVKELEIAEKKSRSLVMNTLLRKALDLPLLRKANLSETDLLK